MGLGHKAQVQAIVVAAALVGTTGVATAALSSPAKPKAAHVDAQAAHVDVQAAPKAVATVQIPAVPTKAAAPATPARVQVKAPVPTAVTTPALPELPAVPLTLPRQVAPSGPVSAAAVASVVGDLQALMPSATKVVAVVQQCATGLAAVLPAAPVAPPTAGTVVLPGLDSVIAGLLGGLGGLGSVVPVGPAAAALPAVPAVPSTAAVSAAVRTCVSAVLDLVPDPSVLLGALQPLSGLPASPGFDVDALTSLAGQLQQLASAGAPDPASIIAVVTSLAGHLQVPTTALAPLQALLPSLPGLSALPTGTAGAAPALALVQQVLSLVGPLLPAR